MVASDSIVDLSADCDSVEGSGFALGTLPSFEFVHYAAEEYF